MSWRLLPQSLYDDYPWLKDVAAAFVVLQDLWHQYQNLVILVGLVLVARKLQSERLLLTEQIDTLGQMVKATRDEAEAVPAPQVDQSLSTPPEAVDGSVANWETMRAKWAEARDRLELAIEGIRRANVRRKYSKMPRTSYRAVITALEKDLGWGPTIANNLRQMDTMFHRLKFHPDRVTPSDVQIFMYLFDVPNTKLPRLPDEELADEPAVGVQVQSAQAA